MNRISIIGLLFGAIVSAAGTTAVTAQTTFIEWALPGSGDWNITDNNWSGSATTFTSDGTVDVSFNTSSDATITVSPGMNPAWTTANPTGGTLQFNGGPISGAGGLTKTGANTLRLNGTNDFTGKTSIEAGRLWIGNGSPSYLTDAGVAGALGAPTGADATIDMYNGTILRIGTSSPRDFQLSDRILNFADTSGAGTVTLQVNDNDTLFGFGGVTATGHGAKLFDVYTGIGGNGDRQSLQFDGPITDVTGDGSPLSMRVTFRTQTSNNSYVSLADTSTFTGGIELVRGAQLGTGYFTVGGIFYSAFGSKGGSMNAAGGGTLGAGNFPGSISLDDDTVFNYLSSASQTLSGDISGTGQVDVGGGGTVSFSGSSTLTGDINVKGGSAFELATAGGMTFYPQDDLSSNKVTGAGSATFDGSFTFDTSGVTLVEGTWTLVDVSAKSFTSNFNVAGAGWSESSDVWTKVDGLQTWTFTEADGTLALESAAVFSSFGTTDSTSTIDNNAQTITLVVPKGTDPATLAPSYTITSGVCDQPNGGVPTPSFADTSTVTYTITDGGTIRPYAVTVLEATDIFNVSFVQFTPSVGNFEDPATLVGPAGGSLEIWNQFAANSGSNLFDSVGAATSVSISTNYSECRDRNPGSGLAVLEDGLTDFAKGVTRTITISGLTPGDFFDVWIASSAAFNASPAGERSNGTFTTANSTTTVGGQSIDQSVSANTATWEQTNNYVVFEKVEVDTNGDIIFSAASTSGFRLVTSGVQIIPFTGDGGAATAFSAWADSNGLTEGVNDAQADDADSGGKNNLYEFALGGDPLDGNDDGALLNHFVADGDGDTDSDSVLTILVRSDAAAGFAAAGSNQVATADGVIYTVSGDSTLPVAGGVGVNVASTAVTTGLPPAPFGYSYVSFLLAGSTGEGLGEGYYQVTVEPAAP